MIPWAHASSNLKTSLYCTWIDLVGCPLRPACLKEAPPHLSTAAPTARPKSFTFWMQISRTCFTTSSGPRLKELRSAKSWTLPTSIATSCKDHAKQNQWHSKQNRLEKSSSETVARRIHNRSYILNAAKPIILIYFAHAINELNKEFEKTGVFLVANLSLWKYHLQSQERLSC